VICKAVGEVKVELERPAVCAEQFRERRYLKTTTISSSAIPTCVFSFVKGEKRSHGSLICFLLGEVHSAKQAAMVTGAFFVIGFGSMFARAVPVLGRNVFREVERLGIDTPKASFDRRLIFCDECT
jgi:hypothetical protein